jgi:predicted transcriptional regulator
MRYRDRIEIINRILEATNVRNGGGSGCTKTRIMYLAFVSHGQMKQYLSILADNGLLQYDSLSQTFMTTEKGRRFLKSYREMDEMIKIPPAQQQSRQKQQQQQYFLPSYPGEDVEVEEQESLVLPKTPEQQPPPSQQQQVSA